MQFGKLRSTVRHYNVLRTLETKINICFNYSTRRITRCHLLQERTRHLLLITKKLEGYLEVDFEASHSRDGDQNAVSNTEK